MDYTLHLVIQVAIFAVLALGQNLILGRGGMLFVAQSALFAVGAYGAAIATSQGISSTASLLVGTGAAIFVGMAMGLSALRLRGDYLLVASLGLCEIVRSILNNWDAVTGGAAGFMNIPALAVGRFRFAGPGEVAPVAVGVFSICVAVYYLIDRSPYGRLLAAVGEDAEAVRGLGKSVRRAKAGAIAFSSAWAGLAGGIWAFYVSYLDPTGFTVWDSVLVLAMVVLGGSGSIVGAVLGASTLVILPELMRFAGLPNAIAGPLRQIVFGAALVVFMRFRPEGLIRADRAPLIPT